MTLITTAIKGVAGDVRFSMLELSPKGTTLNSYTRITGTQLEGVTAEVMPDGTLWCFYNFDTEGTIQHVKYNTSGEVVAATAFIATYGGSTRKNYEQVGPGGSNQWPAVVQTSLCYSTLNKYILTYNITHNNQMFYKVLNSNGSILFGKDRDMTLMNNTISAQDRGGLWQGRFKSERYFDGDVMVHLNSYPKKDEIMGLGSAKYDVGGKATYLARSNATINIEDLFNRMS